MKKFEVLDRETQLAAVFALVTVRFETKDCSAVLTSRESSEQIGPPLRLQVGGAGDASCHASRAKKNIIF